jgi:epsilon-lactone hydrolase
MTRAARHPVRHGMDGLRLPPALMRRGVRQFGRWALDPDLPWEVQRRRLGLLARASPLPRGTTVSETFCGGLRAEVVVAAAAAATDRTVVHFHGGGYCVGSVGMARSWAAHLSAQAGCRVMLPDYRLAPEHPYPAAVRDAEQVMSDVLSNVAPASTVVSGDSAGAGLALSLVLAQRDRGGPLPAGCILVSPWLDVGRDRRARPELVRADVLLSPPWLEACARAYARPSEWPDPSVSPLHAAHGGLPPLLIQAASDDLLAPDAHDLAASTSAAGGPVTYTRWPRMWHDFALQPGMLAAADSALAQAAWFVRSMTGLQ